MRPSRLIGGSADTSSVATCVPSRPKPLSVVFQFAPGASVARSMRDCATLGVRTSSHTSLSARNLPLVAITRILPLPSFEPDFSARKPSFSSGRVKAIVVDESPTGVKRASVCTSSFTSLMDASAVNTDTGRRKDSSGPMTRGIVGRIISAWRTGTDFSAEP